MVANLEMRDTCSGKGLVYVDQVIDARDPDEALRAEREFRENQRTEQRDLEKVHAAFAKYLEEARREPARRKARAREVKMKRAGDYFMRALLLAVVLYPVIGVGSCLVRFIAIDKNKESIDRFSAAPSFTQIALYASLLIMVVGIIGAVSALLKRGGG